MKRQFSAIFILALTTMFLISINIAEAAFAEPQANQFHSYLKLGIKKTFNMEFPDADAYFRKAIALEPENPAGHAYLAMTNLFAYEMTFDDTIRKNHQDSMLRYVDEALARGEKRIGKNPKDSKAYLAMAMAKVTRFSWLSQQKQYFNMAREASAIWEYLEKAKESDPHNYDLYLLMGSFRYHIDHLPGLTRFLSSLIITAGDKQKGLQELELAAQKGDLLKQLALRELKDIFPNNYNFSFTLANALSDLGRFDDAFNIAWELDKNIRTGIPPFAPQIRPRHDLLLGRIFFTQGNYVKAEESLQKALKDTAPYNARVRALAYLRLGMISDIRKDRKIALDYYSKALDVKNAGGTAQIDAKKYLETPYMPKP